MVESKAELDPAFFELFKHRKITRKRLFVMPVLLRFNAGPFNRHTEHAVTEFAQHREILRPEIPEIAGFPRRFFRVVEHFAVPVSAVNVVAFNLIARRCGAPDKIRGK